MKKRILILSLLCASLFSVKAQSFQFDSIGTTGMVVGKVMLKGDSWIIRSGDGNNARDYYAINLSDAFKINDQNVVFEAAIGKVPANVRMVGTPIKLQSIRKLYKTKPKDTGTTDAVKPNTIQFDSVGYVKKAAGTIIKIGETYLIEHNENNSITRYVPDHLPADFREEGLHIVFSGVVGKNDPNVRAMGQPFKIKELMSVEETVFDRSDVQDAVKDLYPVDSVGYLQADEGVIKKMNGAEDTFIIEMQGGTKKYIPFVLPKEFRQENMIVIVSGVIGKIPANVRLSGTPLDIHTIEKK